MNERNKETARSFINAISRKMPEGILAEDFSGWSGLSGDIPGPVYVERTALLAEVFPQGLDFTFQETIAEGNIVALRCTSHGVVHDGTIYENDYHYQFHFDGAGRIRHVREYMNVQRAAEVIRPALMAISGRREQAAR